MMLELEKPDWKNARKVHEWKNHIPDYIKAAWDTFDHRHHELLFRWADEMASNERWE